MNTPHENTKENQSPATSLKTFVDHDEVFTSSYEPLSGTGPAEGSRSLPAQDGDTSSSVVDDDGNDTELDRGQSIVQELAREYTRHSAVNADGSHMALFGSDDPDSPLNPNGKCFSAHKWATAIANFTNEHGSGYRTAGFSYQDLNVFVYGQETDYQKDVGNIWLELPGLTRKLLSKRGSERHIYLLRDFNGVF